MVKYKPMEFNKIQLDLMIEIYTRIIEVKQKELDSLKEICNEIFERKRQLFELESNNNKGVDNGKP